MIEPCPGTFTSFHKKSICTRLLLMEKKLPPHIQHAKTKKEVDSMLTDDVLESLK